MARVEVRVAKNGRNIFVVNGYVYILTGYGRNAAAQLNKVDETSDEKINIALGTDDCDKCELAKSFMDELENDSNNADTAASETEQSGEATEAKDDKSSEAKGTGTDLADKYNDKLDELNKNFNGYLEFLKNLDGNDFIEIVEYAKTHHNKFPKYVSELGECVNADDAYCSALIDMTRHLGEMLEKKAFSVIFGNDFTAEEKAEFFNALKVINA